MIHPEHTPIITVPMTDSLSARTDFYKPNMSQLMYEYHPDADVTFSFHDRAGLPLAKYVDRDEIKDRFDRIISGGFKASELRYFASLEHPAGGPLYSEKYLNYLADNENKFPEVHVDPKGDTYDIHSHGAAPLVTFSETAAMSEVCEMYYYNLAKQEGLDREELYAEGDRRLSAKIALLRANPDLALMEFGTRRHESLHWHMRVLGRLAAEASTNLRGTSNMYFADLYGLRPMGTSAHEMDMIYGGLAGNDDVALRMSHNRMMHDWKNLYGPEFMTGLTDTYGARFFFADLDADPELLAALKSVRHDSGDPYVWGEFVYKFYTERGIDPLSKSVVFSDGLDIPRAIALKKHFEGRLNMMFGIGTDLTNDLGIKALNIVMKAIKVNGIWTVKLSDNEGKHTGPADQAERYRRVFDYEPLGLQHVA